jgi:hypothetical protein
MYVRSKWGVPCGAQTSVCSAKAPTAISMTQQSIVFEIRASRLSGCGGFQFLAQACFHEAGSKFVTVREPQNIGSRNTHWCNLITYVHLQGRSSGSIKGWLCRGVQRRLMAVLCGGKAHIFLRSVLNSVSLSPPMGAAGRESDTGRPRRLHPGSGRQRRASCLCKTLVAFP